MKGTYFSFSKCFFSPKGLMMIMYLNILNKIAPYKLCNYVMHNI